MLCWEMNCYFGGTIYYFEGKIYFCERTNMLYLRMEFFLRELNGISRNRRSTAWNYIILTERNGF